MLALKTVEFVKTCAMEKDLIEKLKSANTSEVYDALVKIRKSYVRNRHKMKQLQKCSVIQLIIPFLEHPKFCNISLSIIADGCLELGFVNEVIKFNGIDSLMRIMKSFDNDDIQNRACRALGNMAKFKAGFEAVHLMKPVSNIIHFLSETSDANCQQTAVRTLMILGGKSSKTREIITRENGIVSIAKLLHSSNVPLLICSIKAIANFTQNCSLSCARQLLELQFFKVLVELHSHTEESVRSHALISLKNLSSQEEVRSGLVKVGAVKLFTEVLFSAESDEMSRLAALALCSCLDHIHMWSFNGTDRAVGLKALLEVLQNQKYQGIHLRVIASLIPLAYESKVSDILLNLDVVQVLIKILELFIDKNKCKSFVKSSYNSYFSSDQYLSESKLDIEGEVEEFHPELQLNISSNMHSKYIVKEYNEIISSKEVKDDNHEKVQDLSPKTVNKWERSLYSFSSITSDYSSTCSPNRIYSPTQKLCTSPDFNYERDYGSPSSGVWSPVSQEGENFHNNITWSPVVSTHSDSSTLEKDTLCKQENDDLTDLLISPTKSTFSLNIDKMDDFEEVAENFVEYNCEPSTSKSDDQVKQVSKLKNKRNLHEISDLHPEFEISRKKLKTENTNEVDTSDSQLGNSVEVKIPGSDVKDISIPGSDVKDISDCKQSATSTVEVKIPGSDVKDISDCKQLAISKQLTDCPEVQRIDHYILLFIWQLSFHLGTKTNSQIADKSCFSVLIEYLCFIHNPSSKAAKVLFNLIKNRYCFQKLIVSGFVSELEEKMTSEYSCVRHTCIKQTYTDLVNVGRQEAESDYGIGTLSHILVTSEKLGKLNAVCAMSKLITEKLALHRLLFRAGGLSSLFSFLSDNNVITRKRIMISLCELYQSLTKEQKSEKCCFVGTCSMKTSSKCSYKESFLNVTFSVSSGAKILANREKLCENSEYFHALLSGYFLETKAEVVSLSDISAENLSTIFHFLHGCGSGNCCPYIKRIPFAVLLELLSDCDRFLLLNIKAFVEDRLCHRLFPSTVPKIYKQSKIHNSPALTKRTLDFALNMDTSQKDILCNCFEELINLESSLNFISDIESLIKNLF